MTAVGSLQDFRQRRIQAELRQRMFQSGGNPIEIADLLGNARPGTARYVQALEAIALTVHPLDDRPSRGGAA